MRNFIKGFKGWVVFLSIIFLNGLLFAQGGINSIGSFEQDLPSYWNKSAQPDGSTLSWATDEYRSMGRSLKIEKSATTEAAMWESDNMVDLWSDRHYKDVDIKFGMYYQTMGVNTNPTTEDQKWYVTYTFYREDESVIGEKKFELDQSVASTGGWIADTTDVGEISLTEDAYKTIIRFVGGKDATGTVWTDDYLFVGRGGWAGQDWNTQLGVPTGWFYWLPPIGGNDGELSDGYENTVVTDEEAYSGQYSLKFDIPVGTHDGFVGTVRHPLTEVVPGDKIRISVWVKGANLEPDSVISVGDQWSVALTPIFHTTLGNNEGFGDYWASDIPLKFPNATSFDWKQFYIDVTVPEPPAGQQAKSISIRLHPLGRFQGTVWIDDLEVKVINTTDVNDNYIPKDYTLNQNYPNPFNPSTIISYALPKASFVTLKVYDMLGREIKTLVNNEQNAGTNRVQWNGDNNFGSKVSSGTYIFVIRADEFYSAKKMVLLK